VNSLDCNEIIINNKDRIKASHKCEHEPYEYFKYEITKRNNENQCYVALYEIPPQKESYPYHYHMNNTEVFYIISGNGILRTPDGDKSISKGDVIVCPPKEKGAHKIINTSHTEMLTYLDCDTISNADVVFYPDSNKTGVIVNGQPSRFYKNDDNVDYYENE
jgi:uncharacterized cupin superfamily protein